MTRVFPVIDTFVVADPLEVNFAEEPIHPLKLYPFIIVALIEAANGAFPFDGVASLYNNSVESILPEFPILAD